MDKAEEGSLTERQQYWLNPYGANIRTSRMVLLSNNITDNLVWQ